MQSSISWTHQSDSPQIDSVLHIVSPKDKIPEPTSNEVILLPPTPPLACSLHITFSEPSRLHHVKILSDSRLCEVYTNNNDYLGSFRGQKTEKWEEIKAEPKMECHSLTFKFFSLRNKSQLSIAQIVVTAEIVPSPQPPQSLQSLQSSPTDTPLTEERAQHLIDSSIAQMEQRLMKYIDLKMEMLSL